MVLTSPGIGSSWKKTNASTTCVKYQRVEAFVTSYHSWSFCQSWWQEVIELSWIEEVSTSRRSCFVVVGKCVCRSASYTVRLFFHKFWTSPVCSQIWSTLATNGVNWMFPFGYSLHELQSGAVSISTLFSASNAVQNLPEPHCTLL